MAAALEDRRGAIGFRDPGSNLDEEEEDDTTAVRWTYLLIEGLTLKASE